jgi:hypothetical protein
MRRFATVSHTGRSDGQWHLNELAAAAGRVDVLCRNIQAAFFLSHGLREDVEFYAVFAESAVRQKTVRIDGKAIQMLNPDERSTAARLQQALKDAWSVPDWKEVQRGLAVARFGLEGRFRERLVPSTSETRRRGGPSLGKSAGSTKDTKVQEGHDGELQGFPSCPSWTFVPFLLQAVEQRKLRVLRASAFRSRRREGPVRATVRRSAHPVVARARRRGRRRAARLLATARRLAGRLLAARLRLRARVAPAGAAALAADRRHVRTVAAHGLAALAAGDPRLVRRPLVRRALRVRGLAALARDLALARRVHRREAAIAALPVAVPVAALRLHLAVRPAVSLVLIRHGPVLLCCCAGSW